MATTPPHPIGPRAGWGRRDDGGFVLVWSAMMLLVLVGFAGFSVDLGNWYLRASRLQNTADAAALGGVVFLPTDLAEARGIATKMALGDGYLAGDVVVEAGERPNQLRVTVTDRVDNHFLKVFGFDSLDIRRSALAEFEAPVPMGSPEAYLGNDPELGHNPNLWLNVGSLQNTPDNGDRYHNGACGNNAKPCAAGSPRNPEYSSNGYFLAVKVEDPQPGKDLIIDVFDPAFYEVGDRCDPAEKVVDWGSGSSADALRAAVASRPGEVPPGYYDDAHERYRSGNTSGWCTGDFAAGASPSGNPITTTYLVRKPDDTPWLDSDNPVVDSCQRQFTGYGRNWMKAQTIWQRLMPNSDPNGEWRVTFPPGTWKQTFANTFRQWVTVCRIPAADVRPGTYLLQVRTNAPLGSPQVANNNLGTWGHNRYSVRAGFGPSAGPGAPDPGGVRLFANGRLPMYVNTTGTDTQFYLGRVTPSSVARVLNVTLWDISDGGGGSTGSLRLHPPTEAKVDGSSLSSFSECAFSSSGGTWTTDAGNCSIRFNVRDLDSQRVTIGVPIPAGYDCDEGSFDGCWVTVRTKFNGVVTDTTTWSADILGDPVRLIE